MEATAGSELALGGELHLGRELTVRRLGFGAMRITGPGVWGEPTDPVEAVAVLSETGEEADHRLVLDSRHSRKAVCRESYSKGGRCPDQFSDRLIGTRAAKG